ncbi:RYamide receptor-like [Limulus polyphemus]|uniref:RYamide receptor-like n=1 Tax=Limulus polyphemus TaxID=6850 RepID=A0ABM1BCJ9_LIMPO|nr:RYamide receptor-like [Limulus polyphemus]
MAVFNSTWWNISFDLELNVSSMVLLDIRNNFTKKTTAENSSIPEGVQAIMYIMYAIISLAAIGGNGIICYIVLADQSMRTVTNYFIVNLAVGDLLMAVLCIPFTFVVNLILHRWPFGTALCKIVTYAQAVSVFVSAYTMIAISVDRYIAIIKPLRPRMTKFQAKLMIILVWLVALITPLPTVVVSSLVAARSSDSFHCTEVWNPPEQRYYYGMALMTLQYFLPLLVLIYTYARIAVVVWVKQTPGEAEDNRDQRLAASKRKMVKMMIMVVTVFTFCWLPFNILIVVGDQDQSIWWYKHIQYVWFVCHWLAMSHTSYNPIIYCWMNFKFRNGFHQVIYGLPCFRCSRHHHYQGKSLRRKHTRSNLRNITNASMSAGTVATLDHGLSIRKPRAKFTCRVSRFDDEATEGCNFE